MRSAVLPRRFYARDSRTVAPELLNKILAHQGVTGRIVEVEAYAGPEDPASHAFRGPTPRSAIMFGPPGYLYVYFSYGMHWCANAVCGARGEGSAVLLRALAPVRGRAAMRRRRGGRADRELCSGPARLTEALAIDGDHDGLDLTRGPVRILDDGTPPPADPGVSTRIGLSVAVDRPWRWYVRDDPNLSRARTGGSP